MGTVYLDEEGEIKKIPETLKELDDAFEETLNFHHAYEDDITKDWIVADMYTDEAFRFFANFLADVGMAIVPVNPTQEMINAAEENGDLVNYPAQDAWKWMIETSPFLVRVDTDWREAYSRQVNSKL